MFDYQGEAMAAMKMAVETRGFERVKWVRVAQAWHDLGRNKLEGTDAEWLIPIAPADVLTQPE